MAEREELILELAELTPQERSELLDELRQIAGAQVRTAPPSLSGPTMVEVISLTFEGIGALALILQGVVWAVGRHRERRKKPVVGKIYLPDGEELEVERIDEYLKR